MNKTIVGAIFAAILFIAAVGAAHAVEIIIPGDMITITVAGEPEFTRTVIVDSAGTINLPKAGYVQVAGLSLGESASAIAGALANYLKGAQVTVSIVSTAPKTVAILGQVAKPGTYIIQATTTLADLIQMAGGPTESANLARVVITRKYGKEKLLAANLDAFNQGSDPMGNPLLVPGDSIVVPVKPVEGGSIYMVGEVVLKGPVPYREGMTIREALAAAGGPTEFADLGKVTVRRQNQPDKVTEYAQVVAGDAAANIVLERGDSVFLPTLELKGSYTVKGAVKSPGDQILRGIMKLTDVITATGGLKEKADSTKIKITRKVGGKKQTLNCDLTNIDAGRAENPIVQPGDVITVPSSGKSISPG